MPRNALGLDAIKTAAEHDGRPIDVVDEQSTSPMVQAGKREEARRLHSAIETLEPQYRSVLRKKVAGTPNSEVCAELELSDTALRTRQSRGVKQLRRILEQDASEE